MLQNALSKVLGVRYAKQVCNSYRVMSKQCFPPALPKKPEMQFSSSDMKKNECQSPTVAINGFGRIGQCFFRLAVQNEVNVVAVNQPCSDVKMIAHSLRLDSVHGSLNGSVNVMENSFRVYGRNIKVFHEEEPENIKWKEVSVDYVIDSTGKFTDEHAAKKHIAAGAKKVIITASSKDAPMFVRGMNFCDYTKSMNVVSSSSGATNCATPLIHIMNKKFGVVNCLLTTTHSMTASQCVHDGLSQRAASINIIPESTAAATAVGRIIPELKDKINGDATRVPTMDVSLLKLYMIFKEKTNAEAIKKEIEKQVKGSFNDIITFYDEEKYVSSDFIGSHYSAVVDFNQIFVTDKLVSIGAWYDNEMGYSYRVLDLLKHMIEVDRK